MHQNRTHTPHDVTFQQFLRQPGIARDFMELHLPAELRALCDLSTLKLECSSFVEDNLRQYFSDVLYSLKTVSGTEGYIHVLIEHQSTPDKHMAFRLMRYAVAAMQRHLDAGHKKTPLGDTENAERFIRELAYQVPPHKEKLMNIAQQLEQNGVEKGIRQGLEQGIEQGIQVGEQRGYEKTKLAMAQAMLQYGFDNKTIIQITALSEAELTQG